MSGVSEGHGRYLHWSITDFTGGYIDGVEDNLIPENASRSCNGVISRTIGSLESRPGQLAINPNDLGSFIQGLYPYYFDEDRWLIVAVDGKVGYWDFSSEEFEEISGELDSNAPMLFETCVNYLVGMNGVDDPWKWDGETFSELENAPSAAKFPVLHKEKLFCVEPAHPSSVVWSDSFQPEVWPGVHYWDIKKGDGDEITCLKKFVGELVIFKRRSTHALKGTSLDDMSLDELDSKIGAVGPRAVAQHGLYLYVVSEEGLQSFNGMKFTNLSNVIIPKLWSRVNQESLHKAAVEVWDGLIWFSLPVDGSSRNNLVLIYEPRDGGMGAWWPWGNMDISCFASFTSGDQLFLYTGHSELGRIMQQYVGKADHDLSYQFIFPFKPKPVGAYWESKYFDFGRAATEKKTKRAFVETSRDTSSENPRLIISKDYKDYEMLNKERVDDMIRQYRFENRDRWRYLSVRFEEQAPSGFNVRGILIPFKPKPKPKVRGSYRL